MRGDMAEYEAISDTEDASHRVESGTAEFMG